MNRWKRFAGMISIVLFFSFALSSSASAGSLGLTKANTQQSGWAYSDQAGHMGTKNSTYRFENESVKNTYSSYVTEGIALWGSYINMTYTPASANGVFLESAENSNATAATQITNVDANGHRTSYTITIYKNNFMNGTSREGRIRTIAHEIGHAYGLGHVPDSGQIMYVQYSATTKVTQKDSWGMQVVTHAHVHNRNTAGTYSEYSASHHEVICSACKGIYIQEHTFTQIWTGSHYHSGAKHYYEMEDVCKHCSCATGNKTWISSQCSGPPCILPYEAPCTNETD